MSVVRLQRNTLQNVGKKKTKKPNSQEKKSKKSKNIKIAIKPKYHEKKGKTRKYVKNKPNHKIIKI